MRGKKGQEGTPGTFWEWIIAILLILVLFGVVLFIILSRVKGGLK